MLGLTQGGKAQIIAGIRSNIYRGWDLIRFGCLHPTVSQDALLLV